MSQPAKAVYYDGVTSKPWDALVSVREPNTLEVEVLQGDGRGSDRFMWPLEHKGMQWERNTNMLRLSFGEHPRKVVVVRDELFIKSFALRMRYTGRQGVYDRTLAVARRGPVLFFVAVVAILVCGYLWVLPWAAERLALLTPRSVDVHLGEVVYNQMSPTLNEDTVRSAALQRFGDRLHLSDHYDLHFHVVNDDQVNAFALPGGDIVVFTGIIDGMKDPGQLAGLLAHEATHVEERHSTRMMVRNLAGYLFLSLILGDVNAIVAVVAENADNLRSMSYSRGLETDADSNGQSRMHASGVDPEGMVRLLQLLEEEATDMPEAMSFLSSHPLTEERIAKAQERARGLGVVAQPDPQLAALFKEVKGSDDPMGE